MSETYICENNKTGMISNKIETTIFIKLLNHTSSHKT